MREFGRDHHLEGCPVNEITFVAGEPLQAGDYVQIGADGKLMRATTQTPGELVELLSPTQRAVRRILSGMENTDSVSAIPQLIANAINDEVVRPLEEHAERCNRVVQRMEDALLELGVSEAGVKDLRRGY